MAKNKQQIKFEADVSGFKTNIKEAEKSITNLNNQLKLNQSQLKGNSNNTDLLSQRIESLKQKYDEQTKVVDNTRKSYEKAVEIYGENSKEADNLKNKLLQAETAQQNIKNAIEQANKELVLQTSKLTVNSKKWQESGERLKDYGSKIESVGNKLSVVSGLVVGAGIVSVKSAMGIESSIQQVDKIFGNASDTIKDFAENTAISYNMSTADAYKYSQVYGNLIQSITDDQNENADNTQRLLKASSVIASSTGRSMEDVMDRIRSGLLGNTEAIEDLGVNVNVALLETTDAFRQIAGDRSWDKLTFQEQQQIRLMGILEQTTKKYGDEVNNNTASSVQQLTAKTKNLTTNLGNKLLPTANKLIDKANDLVDSFGDLSDTQQENIIKIGTMVAVAGPAIKLAGTGIQAIGKVASGIGTLTGALGVLKNGTEGASTSSINLATSLSKVLTPTGLVIGAISTFATIAVISYQNATKETKAYAKACENSKDKTLEEAEAIKEVSNSIEEGMQIKLTEIDNTKSLYSELQKITDENGKIKNGYELRAKVITEQLAKSLGIEIGITDNVINKYKDLQKEIDNLIRKKQAEAILLASEEKNNQAINDRSQKMQELLDVQEELNIAKRKENELNDAYNKAYEKINKNRVIPIIPITEQTNLKEQQKAASDLQDKYDSLNNTISRYTSNIQDYQYNYQLYTEGTTESLNKMIAGTARTYQKNEETVKTTYGRMIAEQQLYNVNAKTLYDESIANNNETETQKSLFTMKESQNRLNSLTEELIGMTSATEENTPEVIEAWKQLASGSYSTYYDTIAPLDDDVKKKIEEITGVTIEKTPELVQETQNMANSVLNEVKNNEEFRKEAVKNLNGFLAGLEDEDLRQLLEDSGIDNADEVIKGIREGKTLAEDEGVKILEGLNTGLENTSWKDKLWGTARGIAKSLSGLLTVKANVNGNTSSLPRAQRWIGLCSLQ